MLGRRPAGARPRWIRYGYGLRAACPLATRHAGGRLNITYNGTSADYPQPIDGELSDRELRRISEELVRSGDLPGLWLKDLPHRVFEQFVVDRIHSPKGGLRIYLRPKVPFGNGPARESSGAARRARR